MARLLLSLPRFTRLWAPLRPIFAANCNRRNPAIAAAILERQHPPFAFKLATELNARLIRGCDMFNDSVATAKFPLFTTAAKTPRPRVSCRAFWDTSKPQAEHFHHVETGKTKRRQR